MSAKWPKGKYLAYFQNFTNTYAPIEYLDTLYSEALAEEDIVGSLSLHDQTVFQTTS